MITVTTASSRFAAPAPARGPRRTSRLVLRLFPSRQGGDERGVSADDAELAGTARRAERLVAAGERPGEELRVLPGVHLPLLRQIVLVVDRLHRAHRLARPAVHALVRVDVQHPLALV